MGQGHSYFFPKIFKNVHFQDNKENGLYFFCHLNIQGNSIFSFKFERKRYYCTIYDCYFYVNIQPGTICHVAGVGLAVGQD